MDDTTVQKQERRVLVFVHIPKTAGTTLRAVLSMNEPGARTKRLGNVFKGAGGVDTALIKLLLGERRKGELKGVKILYGHFPFGVREYLPEHLPDDRELRYFTFLREPVDRTLSHYFQVRDVRLSTPSARLPPLAPDATLDDALESGYIHDNLHTRMLSGLPEPFGEVTDGMLEQAKRNLREELVFFGLTERFDESLVLARQPLGLSNILYRSDGRVNRTRPRGDELPQELVQAAERANRYDIELYDYAKELFDSAPEHGQLDFQVELAALRAAKPADEIDLDVPAPEGYDAGPEAWRMLLQARATVLRLQWEMTRHRIPSIPPTVQDEDPEDRQELERDLEVAREKAVEHEREVERLEAARSKVQNELEREVERLKASRSRTEEREQDVVRLKTARSRRKRNAKRGSPKGSDASPAEQPKGGGRSRKQGQRKQAKQPKDARAALSSQAQALADAEQAAGQRLRDLRSQIEDLEEGSASGPNGRASADVKSGLQKLRRRAQAVKQRIEAIEQERADVERRRAALSEEGVAAE